MGGLSGCEKKKHALENMWQGKYVIQNGEKENAMRKIWKEEICYPWSRHQFWWKSIAAALSFDNGEYKEQKCVTK